MYRTALTADYNYSVGKESADLLRCHGLARLYAAKYRPPLRVTGFCRREIEARIQLERFAKFVAA